MRLQNSGHPNAKEKVKTATEFHSQNITESQICRMWFKGTAVGHLDQPS